MTKLMHYLDISLYSQLNSRLDFLHLHLLTISVKILFFKKCLILIFNLWSYFCTCLGLDVIADLISRITSRLIFAVSISIIPNWIINPNFRVAMVADRINCYICTWVTCYNIKIQNVFVNKLERISNQIYRLHSKTKLTNSKRLNSIGTKAYR